MAVEEGESTGSIVIGSRDIAPAVQSSVAVQSGNVVAIVDGIRMFIEQRQVRTASRLMAQTIEFRNQPHAMLACYCRQLLRLCAGHELAVPQFRVRLELETIIHLQHDHIHAAGHDARQPVHQGLRIAALIEVRDQDQVRLGRPFDPVLAIGDRLVDVGAAAQLHAE